MFRLESRNSRYDGHGPRLLDQSGRCLRTLVVGDGRDVYCAYPDVERNRAFSEQTMVFMGTICQNSHIPRNLNSVDIHCGCAVGVGTGKGSSPFTSWRTR